MSGQDIYTIETQNFAPILIEIHLKEINYKLERPDIPDASIKYRL